MTGSAPESAEEVRVATFALATEERLHLTYRWVDRALRCHLVDAFSRAGWPREAARLLEVASIFDRQSLLRAQAELRCFALPHIRSTDPNSGELQALASFCGLNVTFGRVATLADEADVFEASFGGIMAARMVDRGAEELQAQLADALAARSSPDST